MRFRRARFHAQQLLADLNSVFQGLKAEITTDETLSNWAAQGHTDLLAEADEVGNAVHELGCEEVRRRKQSKCFERVKSDAAREAQQRGRTWELGGGVEQLEPVTAMQLVAHNPARTSQHNQPRTMQWT